jgi:hypothetical protein
MILTVFFQIVIGNSHGQCLIVQVVFSCFFALMNNYFGAPALGFVSAFIILQGEVFNDIGWVTGTADKFFGVVWLVAGLVIALINTV